MKAADVAAALEDVVRRRRQLVKLAVILGAEVALAPPLVVITALLGHAPLPVLEAQNRLRRRALAWLHPDVVKPPDA